MKSSTLTKPGRRPVCLCLQLFTSYKLQLGNGKCNCQVLCSKAKNRTAEKKIDYHCLLTLKTGTDTGSTLNSCNFQVTSWQLNYSYFSISNFQYRFPMTYEGYSLKLQLTKPFIVFLPNKLRLQKPLKCNLISPMLDQPVLMQKHPVTDFYSVIDITYAKW